MATLDELNAKYRDFQRTIGMVYEMAVVKHLDRVVDDAFSQCEVHEDRGVVRLQCGDVVLCEISLCHQKRLADKLRAKTLRRQLSRASR